MAIIDITHPMQPNTAVWPGDTPYRLERTALLSKGDTVNLSGVTWSLHFGTHADAPWHFDDSGATIEQVNPSIYFGPCLVIDGRGHDRWDCGFISEQVPPGTERLLIRSDSWTDITQFPKSIPTMDKDVPALLTERGVRLVGLDVPSVDEIESTDLPIHHTLTRAGIAIIESLRLQDVASGTYQLIALPLRIVGGDASPVRAILLPSLK